MVESPYSWLNDTLDSLSKALDLTMGITHTDIGGDHPDSIVLSYAGHTKDAAALTPESMKNAYDVIIAASLDTPLELVRLSFDKQPKNKFEMTLYLKGR